jgi:hypothetical protein
MKLPRFEKKLRVALSWTLELFFPKDLAQRVTLHEVERVQRRLESARQRALIPSPHENETSLTGQRLPAVANSSTAPAAL